VIRAQPFRNNFNPIVTESRISFHSTLTLFISNAVGIHFS